MIRTHLFTSAYNVLDTIRREELTKCERKNTNVFDTINCIAEKDHRTTYQDLFDFINQKTQPNDINIVANSDIYFDDTIKNCDKITKDECYALTRYNIIKGEAIFEDTPGSQDCWIFKGKIKKGNFDIPMGIPGCDNRIAHELKEAGYRVYNPSKIIKSYHIHNTPKSYTNKTERIPPPYYLVPIIGMPKKVFHISLGTHQKAQIKAIESMGNYESIDWTLKQDNIPELQKDILSAVKRYEPESIFMQIQRDGIVTADMVKQWSEAGIKVINWTGDVRSPLPKWYIEVGRECHMSLFTNEPDIYTMRQEGCNADYMNIGYDEMVYFPRGETTDCPEVIFMGNNYSHFPLSAERKQMVKLLKQTLGNKFGLYGSGWGGMEDGNFNGDEVQEARIIRSAKIAINLSHFNYSRYSSDRIQRILGCGTMCITHHFKGLEIDYKNNIHLKTYKNIYELSLLCKHYLKEDDERNQLALNGWRLAYSSQTWAHRIKELSKWI